MKDETNGLYFIAGGTGGIGSEVVLAARNEARLQERARETGARAVPMDATRPEAVTGAFDAALGEGRPLLHPLGLLGEPGDIASAICWLVSPEQSWVTGQVLHVDGGLSTVQAR